MSVLALYSNKGGVGKTAAAVNLSYIAARSGLKTIICDLDPQGAATYYFRVKPKLKQGAKGFVRGGQKLYRSIKGTDFDNLDLLPADFSLRNLDIAFDALKHSRRRLAEILAPLAAEYDLVVLDCPVSVGLLAENILTAVDKALVPMIPTTLSVRTYAQLLSLCRKKNYDTSRLHAFFSMVDRRKKMHRDIIAAVSKKYKGVLQSFIPYLAEIEKMGLYRAPVAAVSPRSEGARAYDNLWRRLQASPGFKLS